MIKCTGVPIKVISKRTVYKHGKYIRTHSKSPEAKHDDDEVHHISEEHQSVDISGSSVLSMQAVVDECLCWLISIPHSEREKEKKKERGSGYTINKGSTLLNMHLVSSSILTGPINPE